MFTAKPAVGESGGELALGILELSRRILKREKSYLNTDARTKINWSYLVRRYIYFRYSSEVVGENETKRSKRINRRG
jgi:hypothetical protein